AMIFVMPKYESLIRDYDIQMPPATSLLLTLARHELLVSLVMVAVMLGVLLIIGRSMERLLWTPWRISGAPTRRLTDRLAWYLPLWGRITQAEELAMTCQVLADQVEAG